AFSIRWMMMALKSMFSCIRRKYKMNIIIVDDDALVVSALTTIVEGSGHTVVETGNSGRGAVRVVEAHQPDLLMADIRMEDLTGLDASKIILDRYDDANVLLLTTVNGDEYISEAVTVGCKGCVV